MKFTYCLQALTKEAGLLDAAKRLALTEVPGTKPWLIQPKQALPSQGFGKATRSASGVRAAAPASRRTASGAWDVSHMAREMGLDK
jgi:hypothetical protein